MQNIVYGPHQISGNAADDVEFAVSRLRNIASAYTQLHVNVQIMPGYQHTDGCYPGDNYAMTSCPLENISALGSYDHCAKFVNEISKQGFADSLSIWASNPTEKTEMVKLVNRIRESTFTVTPTPTGSTISADANSDGKVDGVDYVIWLNHYNQTTSNGVPDGDFNNSGRVDSEDFEIWLTNYI